MNDLVIRETGEIVQSRDIDVSASVSLARAEIDMQISTARAYPRSLSRAMKRITEFATLDEETAEECCYALIRKKKGQREDDDENKPIEGPSIRLAEIAFSAWGNCRADARVITVNRAEKYVEAEGVFHDLETNAATRSVVRRRISTKKGYLFSDDMIVVTGNAACSIAKRNAILAGIPKGVYRPGYRAARAVIAGDLTTLGANRTKVYKAFAAFGVTPAQIHELIDVPGEADVSVDHIAMLRATFSSIKNGEATVNEVFGKDKPSAPEGIADPLGVSKPAPVAPQNAGAGVIPPARSGTEAGEATPDPFPAEGERDPDAAFVNGEATKPSDGQFHPEATTAPATEQRQPTASAVTGLPAPKTNTDYIKHVRAYTAEARSSSALEARWKGEKGLRAEIGVGLQIVSEIEAEVRAKCAALKAPAP